MSVEIETDLEANFEKHFGNLYKASRRDGLTHEESEDLAMDTVTRALGAVSIKSPFPLWLMRVRKNRFIDTHTKKNLRNRFSHDDWDEMENTIEDDLSVESQVEHNLMLEKVSRLLNELTEEQKTVVLLKAEGLEYEQIAKITGVKKPALRARYMRALKTLKGQN